MYESEANSVSAAASEIPPEVLARFSESRTTVTHRSLIPWGEHCTECVWPTCYTTCDLHQPRPDGRCRRFVEGMVRVDAPGSLTSYLVKVSFRRWAKLWSPANLEMHTLSAADRAERLDRISAACIQAIPNGTLRRFVSLKRYTLKKRRAIRNAGSAVRPDLLLIECYNPNPADVSMTVTVRRDDSHIPFQALLLMRPGFIGHRIPFAEIACVVDLTGGFNIELAPNDNPEGLTLYFGGMDFVVEPIFRSTGPAAGAVGKSPCKCVVWDLDNTLWQGTLIEDGPDGVQLKPGVADILKDLDQRGILLSVSSKNNPDDALTALRRFGIEEYFLFPEISWDPKGQAIREIAASLNIGMDSILFVDDSAFEREEARSVCPGLRVMDAAEYRQILHLPECQCPVTDENRKRRLLYRDQQRRTDAQRKFAGEYKAFLRDCRLRLTIRALDESNLDRVHELTQRTNQMNFSGIRYSRTQLLQLLKQEDADTYVLDCQDQFGCYGTIGFCVVARREPRLTDLMFSCRVQGKRIEHAFLYHLVSRYRRVSAGCFHANYRKTDRNATQGKVFDDLGFQTRGEVEGVSQLVLAVETEVPDEEIVTIEDQTAAVPVS